MESVIDIIIKTRKAKKITQHDIAQLLNLSKSTYCEIENKRINLKADDLMKIIKYLEIDLASYEDPKVYLTDDEEELILTLAKKINSKRSIKETKTSNISDSLIMNDNYGEVYFKSNKDKNENK